MRADKYNPYVSQTPTNGDPSSRAFKRRQWKNSWSNDFYAQEGKMNMNREVRRYFWSKSWFKFKDRVDVVEVTDYV